MPRFNCSNKCYHLLSMAVIVVAFSSALGQDTSNNRLPAIVIGPSVHISADNPTAPHAESFLALDPKNPSQLIASSIVYEPGKALPASVYVSRDAGRSWERPT